MTSWPDVPPGMPVHHHCVVSVEHSHHPKHWVDASTAAADLVAWQYPDAVQWVHDKLVNHYDEATPDRDGGRIDDLLDAYVEAQVGDGVDHYRYRPAGTDWYCPTLWERLPQVLQMGRWVLETFQLAPGRKLVLQILGYADTGQPEGVNGKAYAVCQHCQRPNDKPYLGLTADQAEHFGKYGALYASV
jgi:hypothetical protein